MFDQGINRALELIRGNEGEFESFMEIDILVYPVSIPVHFL